MLFNFVYITLYSVLWQWLVGLTVSLPCDLLRSQWTQNREFKQRLIKASPKPPAKARFRIGGKRLGSAGILCWIGFKPVKHVKPIGTQVLLDLQSEKNMLDAKAHVFRSTRGSAMGATVRSTGRGWCRECLPQQGLWQPELRPSKWKFQAGQILVLPCRGVYLSDPQTQRLSDWKNQSWDWFLDKANLPLKNLIYSLGYNQLLALPKGSHQAICFGQAWCSRLSSVCSVQRCRFHRWH